MATVNVKVIDPADGQERPSLATDDFVGNVQIPAGVVNQLTPKITGINLGLLAQTTLFTVPSGDPLVVTDLLLKIESISGVTTSPKIRLGIDPNYDEVFDEQQTFMGAMAVDEFYRFTVEGVIKPIQPAEVLKLDVTGAANGTLTVSAYLFGMFLA